MTHSDPENPKKNPHPVKRYEVTATTNAPGPWDAVNGTAFFEVVNVECTPENKFLGVHVKPTDVPIEFRMDRVDEKTWKGFFYRDSMLDEDYYGLGVCHWDANGITPVFVAHGRNFGAATNLTDSLKSPQSDYFRKSDFLDRTPNPYGALDFSTTNPEYAKNPNAFFSITVSIKEATP